jgi:hypothetical protein
MRVKKLTQFCEKDLAALTESRKEGGQLTEERKAREWQGTTRGKRTRGDCILILRGNRAGESQDSREDVVNRLRKAGLAKATSIQTTPATSYCSFRTTDLGSLDCVHVTREPFLLCFQDVLRKAILQCQENENPPYIHLPRPIADPSQWGCLRGHK